MTLLTVPVATLSLNWLLGSYVQYVAGTDSSLSLRLSLSLSQTSFISAQPHKQLHQTEISEAFLWHLQS